MVFGIVYHFVTLRVFLQGVVTFSASVRVSKGRIRAPRLNPGRPRSGRFSQPRAGWLEHALQRVQASLFSR